MPALTETEARARAALLDVTSYDVFADLTAEPVRSRTEIRFGCRQPGAATFAELTAPATRVVLNGRELAGPADGRLALPGLAAQNVLTVEAEVADGTLSRFTDPAADWPGARCCRWRGSRSCSNARSPPPPRYAPDAERAGWLASVAAASLAAVPAAGAAAAVGVSLVYSSLLFI